jgi:hypothetical protein
VARAPLSSASTIVSYMPVLLADRVAEAGRYPVP